MDCATVSKFEPDLKKRSLKEEFDLTKDFCLEKEKWFIPVIESEENDEIFFEKVKLIRQCKTEVENIYSWKGTHRCDKSKYFVAEHEYNMKMGDAKKFIEYLFSKKVQLKFSKLTRFRDSAGDRFRLAVLS
jgi:hypothetical protein